MKKEKNKVATYTLTLKQLDTYRENGRKEGYNEAIDKCVSILFALTYLMLRDEFKFGKTRMLRAMGKLATLVGDLSFDYFSIDDIVLELKREVGVNISKKSIYVPDVVK